MDSNQSFHTLQKQLFQSMRFNILETQISRQEKDRLHSAYVYAWKVGVFPAQQDY